MQYLHNPTADYVLLWRYQKTEIKEFKSLVWASNNINESLIFLYIYFYNLAMNYYMKTDFKGIKYAT
jgi:hypothetical protein